MNRRPLFIDKYLLFELLGRGCMKEVYAAQHEELYDDVAVAILQTSTQNDWERRFAEELESFSKLSGHENIIEFYGGGLGKVLYSDNEEGECLYFAMELAEDSLASYLGPNGMDLELASNWFLAICQAVEFAHSQDILHRDIKPDNILICGECIPKLADFGFVRDLKRFENWTETKNGLGTAGYVAPEQLEGAVQLISRAADVYSLGATLLEMMIGRKRFHGYLRDAQQRDIIRPCQAVLNLLDQVQLEASQRKQEQRLELISICRSCLEPDLTKRLPDVATLIALLEKCHISESTRPKHIDTSDSGLRHQ